MREIKFRAWDGEKLRYDVTGFEHGLRNEMDAVFLDGDFYKIVESLGPEPVSRKDVIMQYTGLRDSKGKEIYEGDIVRLEPFGNFLVVFEDGAFDVCPKEFNTHLGHLTPIIVGNVHENPELIEMGTFLTD